jgi:protein transport protein SEC24
MELPDDPNKLNMSNLSLDGATNPPPPLQPSSELQPPGALNNNTGPPLSSETLQMNSASEALPNPSNTMPDPMQQNDSKQVVRPPMPVFAGRPPPMSSNAMARPPMPVNSVRPNIPGNSFTRPPMPNPNAIRPPMPGANAGLNAARPPMPNSNMARPPIPGVNTVRPPMPGINTTRPLMPGVNVIRPPMPGVNTVRPPMPGMPNSDIVRPPMPGMPNSNIVRPPIPGINTVRPPMPTRPPMPNPNFTGQSMSNPNTLVPPMPNTSNATAPNPNVMMPPMPSLDATRPAIPTQNSFGATGPPFSNPNVSPMAVPLSSPVIPQRPPMPVGYAMMNPRDGISPQPVVPFQSSGPQPPHQQPQPPQQQQPKFPGPPIPGMPTLSPTGHSNPQVNPLSPNNSFPLQGPVVNASHMNNLQQQQPMPPIPQSSTSPQVPLMPPMRPQVFSPGIQSQSMQQPMMRPPQMLQQPQMMPQSHMQSQMQPPQSQFQPPMNPQQQQMQQSMQQPMNPQQQQMQMQQPMYSQQQQQQPMYSQQQMQHPLQHNSFPSHSHSGQALPGAPQSVTSSSHSMNEFYEPKDPLIVPNISSDFLTCSLGKIPRSASLLGKARTPFGLTVSFYPFGDVEKDRVAEVSGAIVRCRRCRTYLNPFAELIEQNSRWRCNICYLANEFPPNYDFDPVTQQTIDRRDHQELKSFVYDFTNAPVEYTVRPPQAPVFVFVLEVTAGAVVSGLFAASCRVIQEQLDSIPNEDGRARIALLTFDQRLQFYKMTPGEENARVLVVADAADPFLPACEDLLVNLSECRGQLDRLLDQLPSMYSSPSKGSPALGPVLQAAHMLLKSVGGKIVVINATLPTQFEGALKARDDARLLGTAKESTLLQPANQFYKMFASDVVKDQICVDLFVAPPQLSPHTPLYTDLASLSGLAKYTGGKLHYYPEFGSGGDAVSSKFCGDLRRFLGQQHGFEAVLRIRASQGISLTAYHGSFFLRQTDLLSLPNVNSDHSFSAQASIDENLQGSVVSFQAALLHTTCRGERRIRVINFSAPITDNVPEIFTNMNVNGIAGILAKMAVEKVLANRLEDAREAVLNKCSDVIAAYKTQNGLKANTTLLLPENMRNFPITLHALIKSIALRCGTSTSPDLRAFYLTALKSMSAIEIIALLLPRFYAIHSMDSEVKLHYLYPFLFLLVL